jgi:cell division protease FtsH
MSDDLGPASYGIGETHPFLGRELAAPREFAESTAARIDAAVAELLEQARITARQLLEKHRTTLDALATELITHEAVDARRLDEILVETGALPAAKAAVDGTAASVPTVAPAATTS